MYEHLCFLYEMCCTAVLEIDFGNFADSNCLVWSDMI